MRLTRHHAPVRYSHPVDRLASEIFGRDIAQFFGTDDIQHRAPRVNVIERKDDFKLELLAPGFRREDLKLNVQDDMLTISGEKQMEELKEEERYTRREFGRTKFERSFRLPENLNTEAIKAEHINGVLTVLIPKMAESKPQSRSISIG